MPEEQKEQNDVVSIVARIEKIIVATEHHQRKIEMSFVGDVLYRIDVPAELATHRDPVTFQIDGIRHVLNQAMIVLYLETEDSDF